MEDQNIGRAGRNGQNGSYSLIFMYNSSQTTVDLIKKKREEEERKMVEYFNKNELVEIIKGEELFNDYKKFRKDVIQKLNNECIKEDNEYSWGKIFNSKECFEKKKKIL